tara:strand:+ start:84264 stop:86027 length:1764 start_codon:yes stop_codon:yes gene_type:complete
MSAGFEVCIHRDGRWEVYSFFESDQESDAIYQARDISNNYSAVCVLWSSKMRVLFFKSRNENEKKPSYMDVRSDLKLARKVEKPKKKYHSTPQLKQQPQPQPKKVKEDPHFTEQDKQRAMFNSLAVALIGLTLTFMSPSILTDDAETYLKLIIIATSFIISAFFSFVVYQVSEQSARLRNQGQDIDYDMSWRNAGMSDDTLKKLAQKQSPELKDAISNVLPNIVRETPAQSYKASAHNTSQITSASPSNSAANAQNKIQTAQDNNAHTKNELQEDDDAQNNALAEASLREVLTEHSRIIKAVSYDKEADKLNDAHELPAILYLSGIASYAIRNLNLPQKTLKESVPLILTRLNVNPAISENYLKQLSNYIHTPRHSVLFDQAVKDAKAYMSGTNSKNQYETVLNKWLDTQNESSNSFFGVVMFTDIENFSESTRLHGEKWMIDVLHAHNDIVRKVIEQYKGQEIKHTGDGILAMFSNAHKAIDAAATIQNGLNIFSTNMPNRAFKLRIGIGAGDIISIDNDIFGSCVNLAARIMPLAKGGQIAITEDVHGVCEDSNYSFIDLGEQELKGFTNQHVYLQNWLHKDKAL